MAKYSQKFIWATFGAKILANYENCRENSVFPPAPLDGRKNGKINNSSSPWSPVRFLKLGGTKKLLLLHKAANVVEKKTPPKVQNSNFRRNLVLILPTNCCKNIGGLFYVDLFSNISTAVSIQNLHTSLVPEAVRGNE